jgi:DNA-binding response OmpR family regulator
MSVENLVVAICFNDLKKSQEYAESLKTAGINGTFILSSNYNQFLIDFMSAPKIDCLIVEENYDGCLATDFIQKLKQSQKYKKTAAIIMVEDLSKISNEISEAKADFIVSHTFDAERVVTDLKNWIEKSGHPIIPENFNILVLDNNKEILEIVSAYLKRMNHKNIELCTSIADAKDKLAEIHYDLLLLDWNLDDGTCLDILEFIKHDVRSKMIKNHLALTIVITGRDAVDDIMTLLRYGVKDHIIKPFDFDEFEDKVSYSIEKYKSIKGI